jgi:hypothetical protein
MSDQDAREHALGELEDMLERKRPINIIRSLLDATQQSEPIEVSSLKGAAVCLDTNVFFKLASMSERAQVIDYLASQHEQPLIVSAQSMLEVWNNYLNAIDTIAVDIRKKLGDLTGAMMPLDAGFSSYRDRFESVLADFREEYGHLHKEGMKERVKSLVEILEKRALYSEVSRVRFERFFSARKITKTPPGFRDDGAGDYYVWLDFLFGLRLTNTKGADFSRAVLVTDDRKIDWVKGGAAHPTLVAECMDYVGVPLEIWTVKRLVLATR